MGKENCVRSANGRSRGQWSGVESDTAPSRQTSRTERDDHGETLYRKSPNRALRQLIHRVGIRRFGEARALKYIIELTCLRLTAPYTILQISCSIVL